MNSDIYDTGSVSNTQNPQGSAPAPGASDASDFQQPAGQDALNTQTDSLSVQETGDPITGVQQQAASDFPLGWVIIIGVSVIIAVVVIFKMIKDMIEEDKASLRPAKSSPASSTRKPTAAKKPAKSVSRSGKKKPAKKSKKRSSKRK